MDTSVWIDHLASGDQRLFDALDRSEVLGHPFVVGELACGNLANRREVLALLQGLPQAPSATDDEVLGFIASHGLMGRGIGYIDAHLLVSVALAGDAALRTRDRRLSAVAADLGLDEGWQ